MDGGSYNNIVRTSSPFNQPSSAVNPNTYKANVNRTKTRKWVEARQNNYDGDDWGNDYDDDEREEPVPLPLQKAPTAGLPSTLRAVSQPLQARHIDTADAYGRRSFGDPPASQGPSQESAGNTAPGPMNEPLTSQNPSQPVYSMERPSEAQPSPAINAQALPVYAQDTSSSGQASTAFPPRKSSIPSTSSVPLGHFAPQIAVQPEYSADVPANEGSTIHANAPVQASSPPPGASKPKLVRPSDIYKRMSQEKEKERLSIDSNRPSLDGITGRGSDTASPELNRTSGEQRRKVSFDKGETADPAQYGDRPFLATVAEKEQSADNSPVKPSTYSIGEELRLKGPGSTSPQLPEVSRMSMFGEDFFASSMKDFSSPKAASFEPIAESQESQPETTASTEAKVAQTSVNDASRAPAEEAATKKTVHGHLVRPSLPGGWVSDTTNVTSSVATPSETPEGSVFGADRTQDAPAPTDGPAKSSIESNDPPVTVAPTLVDTHSAERKSDVASGERPQERAQHPTPQSLPPLQTQDPLKNTSGLMREEPALESASGNPAPASSVYQDSPQSMAQLQSSTAASPGGPYSPAAPGYSQSEFAQPSFAPSLAGPRKSTLSSIATASPLKESDKLSEEIMKSLSPTPDAAAAPNRLGPPTPTSPNAPEQRGEDRSLSGIYDDYYGFQEDKTLQETGRTLKPDVQTSQESASSGPSTQPTAFHSTSNMPEIRPLSPKKTGDAQSNTDNRERRFSFDAGPEQVTLSPVEAPTSTAVSFGSSSDRQQARPEYKVADQPESTASPPVVDTAASSQPVPSQLQPGSPIVTHQVSQLTIGGDNDVDVGTIDQPSPVSAERSAVSTGDAPIPQEDKVLVQPGLLAEEASTAPEVVSEPVTVAEKPEAIPEAVDAMSAPARNSSAKIMPFREILSIGLPQHRIQKFDDTRLQFFQMDTGLSEWLRHMQGQEVGSNAGRGQGGNDLASPTGAPASQQPYYQQYLNASNPNLTMPPPTRSGTSNLAGQSPTMNQGQGQFGASGFNTGGQVGTKGKELLQAAGVLGNKGVKTGMKFFNKSKTKLRERVNQ